MGYDIETIQFLSEPKPNYEKIWNFQKKRLQQIVSKEAPEALIFCEHELCITKGRRTQEENLLVTEGARVFEIERGGDVTLHAPGQLVMYPLIKLQGEIFPKGLHEFLRFCEEACIQMLCDLGLEAGRFGATGVWIKNAQAENKKIASLGIAVRRWVTYHGLALNVSNELQDFKRIRPCDFEASVMTSMSEQGIHLNVSEAAALLELKMRELLAAERNIRSRCA